MKKESAVPGDIEEYLAAFPARVRRMLESIRTAIRQQAPDVEESISYGMPTFRLGRHRVHFAGYEHHVGFYPGAAAIVKFRDELTPYKTGKGTIQFPLDRDMPLELIRRVTQFRLGAAAREPTGARPRRSPVAPSIVCSFPPIESKSARVLVLGSMPGVASLRAGRYYAHPHNAFWSVMGKLFDAGPSIAYEKRVRILQRAGLAVWDVLASCVREGSLDSDIDESTIVPNDFAGFFATHPRVHHVFFNGGKAEHSFRRYVLPQLSNFDLAFTRLPSTSPAHASLNLEKKVKAWRVVAEALKKSRHPGCRYFFGDWWLVASCSWSRAHTSH